VLAVTVEIEVPRGGFVKREAGQGIDYVSPLPCPFNYGCVPGSVGDDGDPVDALVLGPRLAPGSRVATTAWLRVVFVDDGAQDDKLICGPSPPRAAERALVASFFAAYALARTVLNRARGRGSARYLGIAPLRPASR
jgi:inorganic pyrophosphatase